MACGRIVPDSQAPTALDVGAGPRRLAEDAGYVPPAGEVPPVSLARQQLSVVVRWVLDQPGAAVHVERLAEAIGRRVVARRVRAAAPRTAPRCW